MVSIKSRFIASAVLLAPVSANVASSRGNRLGIVQRHQSILGLSALGVRAVFDRLAPLDQLRLPVLHGPQPLARLLLGRGNLVFAQQTAFVQLQPECLERFGVLRVEFEHLGPVYPFFVGQPVLAAPASQLTIGVGRVDQSVAPPAVVGQRLVASDFLRHLLGREPLVVPERTKPNCQRAGAYSGSCRECRLEQHLTLIGTTPQFGPKRGRDQVGRFGVRRGQGQLAGPGGSLTQHQNSDRRRRSSPTRAFHGHSPREFVPCPIILNAG